MIPYLLEHNRFAPLFGILCVLGIATLVSRKRSNINWMLVLKALFMQLALGWVVMHTMIGQTCVQWIATKVEMLYLCARAGISFMFGNLADPQGPWGFIFPVQVLPVIIFFAAFTALLFHGGLIQRMVMLVNHMVRPTLGTSGPETVCAIANSFLGQTEAPLLIRHYLRSMTRSEMLAVMVSGMATISGGILLAFVAMGVPAVHLLTASVMSIPGSLMIAKILYPETEHSAFSSEKPVFTADTVQTKNIFDAIATGTLDGLNLALNVGAMLISFLALLGVVHGLLRYGSYSVNQLLMMSGSTWHMPELTLDLMFAYLFAPVGYLLGLEGAEAFIAGQLLGTKVAINELIAYSCMMHNELSQRTINILTYALCGFSNFSCIGIQIGGIGALVPERRAWIAELGMYAVLGGTLSNILTAMIAALLL